MLPHNDIRQKRPGVTARNCFDGQVITLKVVGNLAFDPVPDQFRMVLANIHAWCGFVNYSGKVRQTSKSAFGVPHVLQNLMIFSDHEKHLAFLKGLNF